MVDFVWFLKFQMASSAITQQECHFIRKKKDESVLNSYLLHVPTEGGGEGSLCFKLPVVSSNFWFNWG